MYARGTYRVEYLTRKYQLEIFLTKAEIFSNYIIDKAETKVYKEPRHQ